MYILKNALISIFRNKGRNILIGIIIFIISLASTIMLAINNTASDLIASYESAYEKEVTISFNRENMMKKSDFSSEDGKEKAKENFSNISSYTIDDIEKFANSKYVKSYYYTYDISLNGSSIQKVTDEKADDSKKDDFHFDKSHGQSSLDFTLMGYSSAEAMSEFIDGNYEITQITDDAWDNIFKGKYVFISDELASYNNTSLNDKIELSDENGNKYEFEVVGIYKEKSNENSMEMFSNSANTIITNADEVVSITSSNNSIKGKLNPTFIIDDYKNVSKIQKEFYSKGLDKNYVLESNEEKVSSSLSSILNVRSFSVTFLIVTLAIGVVVLFVINMINIRERKYEIGVLRTIGMSKLKLTIQFTLELLIIAFISLIIGTGVGFITSKNVSNTLLSNEIKNSEKTVSDIKSNFGGPESKGGPSLEHGYRGMPNVQAYDKVDAVVNVKVVGELLVIGLTLVFISSTSSMITIQRFSPLTILKERS
ncbi:MAG: FtsX-like permease family protein [Bacilli bacterium]|nr:FtsX-like permease family protein [Bacilli bacterium]